MVIYSSATHLLKTLEKEQSIAVFFTQCFYNDACVTNRSSFTKNSDIDAGLSDISCAINQVFLLQAWGKKMKNIGIVPQKNI